MIKKNLFSTFFQVIPFGVAYKVGLILAILFILYPSHLLANDISSPETVTNTEFSEEGDQTDSPEIHVSEGVEIFGSEHIYIIQESSLQISEVKIVKNRPSKKTISSTNKNFSSKVKKQPKVELPPVNIHYSQDSQDSFSKLKKSSYAAVSFSFNNQVKSAVINNTPKVFLLNLGDTYTFYGFYLDPVTTKADHFVFTRPPPFLHNFL